MREANSVGAHILPQGVFMVSVLPWLMLYLPNSSQKLTATGAPISSVSKTVLQVNSTQMESSEPVTHLRNQRKRKKLGHVFGFGQILKCLIQMLRLTLNLSANVLREHVLSSLALRFALRTKELDKRMNLLNTSAEAGYQI